jgi:sarcosine oxidase subunit gamma
LGEEAGVTLQERRGLLMTLLIARKGQVAEARRLAEVSGVTLPPGPTFTTLGDCTVLWAGPEQWLVVAAPPAFAQAEDLARVCGPACMVVDQSDARAVVSVLGHRARDALVKGFAVDLHPRVFKPGDTALTPVGGIAAQIWQTDATPSYNIAVPRSYAESFWHWLIEASAEFGSAVVE